MKKLLPLISMALLAAGMLIMSGCSDKTEDPINSGLEGSWSNREEPPVRRTFIITSNGSFTATLNPAGGEGEGTVTGVLNKEGDLYEMNNMIETTGKDWGKAVAFYNKTLVHITLSDSDNVFTLECPDDAMVEQFFGGTYYRE